MQVSKYYIWQISSLALYIVPCFGGNYIWMTNTSSLTT